MALTWKTYTPSGISGDALSIAYGNGMWLISTTVGIYKENADGTWRKVFDFPRGCTISFINGNFYVLAMITPQIAVSKDGENWQIKTIPTELDMGLRSIAYGNGKFCISADWSLPIGNGEAYGRSALLSTTDFFTWDIYRPKDPNLSESLNPEGYLEAGGEIAFGNNVFATMVEQAVFFTADGKTWNRISADFVPSPDGIAFSNGRFVAGRNEIYTSSTLATWTEIYHPTKYLSLKRAKYRNGYISLCGFRTTGIHLAKVSANNVVTVEQVSDVNANLRYIYGGGDFDYAQGKYRIVHMINRAGTYITEAYEPENVYIKSVSPSSGFVNEKVSNRFSWLIATITGDTIQNQKSAQLQWQITTSSAPTTQTINIPNGNKFVDIAPNTFPNSGIRWRVNAVSAGGASTGWTDWYTITTVDAAPFAPIGLSPNSRPINGMIAQRFSWRHNISTGTAQTKFDIQYSRNNVNWTSLASQNTAVQEYTVAANFFPSGALYWRVRTYNSDGVAGPWAMASITIQAAPPAPSVTVQGTGPRPTVAWQSPEQVSYQVTAGDQYDSGEMYGVARNLKIPIYLKDGETAFRVRVMNAYGFWSNWGTAAAIIKNESPGNLFINTQSVLYGVRLTWPAAYPIFYIYRDGELVGKGHGASEYVDYLSDSYVENLPDSKHVYQVRGVTSEDYYTMSNEAIGLVKMDSAAVAVVGEYDWVKLTHRAGGAPEHNVEDQQQTTFKWYSGRTRPVEETFGRHNVTHSFSYSVDSMSDVYKLNAMQSKNVVYKSTYGDIAVGNFDSFSYMVRSNYINVSFTIVEVAQEKVEYEQ